MSNTEKTSPKAAELRVNYWIDGDGNKTAPIRLKDHKGKFKIIYGFQNWCPGCHSIGLPSLKKMVDALQEDKNVVFFAVQTVFEGFDENTADKLLENQLKYDLKIPFGHDDGSDYGEKRATIMTDFQTGGTPWFLLIDEEDTVVFSDFHINVEGAIAFLKSRKK
ncbi:peroxiredoxin family protein [Flavobacterium sp. FlaQc-50]|uniref:peroxiredoxin family protein n=1 Tax=unclassified Flavobacterium TaxID=196869 RepID=UPI00375723EF